MVKILYQFITYPQYRPFKVSSPTEMQNAAISLQTNSIENISCHVNHRSLTGHKLLSCAHAANETCWFCWDICIFRSHINILTDLHVTSQRSCDSRGSNDHNRMLRDQSNQFPVRNSTSVLHRNDVNKIAVSILVAVEWAGAMTKTFVSSILAPVSNS